MSRPIPQENAPQKKKNSLYAASTKYYHVFAKMLDEPPYVHHSAETDRIDAQMRYLGSDLQNERIDARAKFVQYNLLVNRAQKMQVAYILKGICQKANRSPIEAQKYIFSKEPLTYETFIAAVDELSVVVDNEGNILAADGGIYDPNVPNTDSFAKNKAPKKVPAAEINQLVVDSALEENTFSAEDPEHEKMKEENAKSEERMIAYHKELLPFVLKETGYTAEELDETFENCFSDNPAAINYDKLAEKRREFITAKMAELPKGSKNEAGFLAVNEKLDIAMRAYLFPKHNITEIDESKAFSNGSKKEYEALALNTIKPTDFAKSIESKFMKYFDSCSSGGFELDKATKYIVYLKTAHAKRPFWTRFFDYFKHDGTDSTIKRIENRIKSVSAGRRSGAFEASLKRNEQEEISLAYEERYESITEDSEVPVWEGVDLGMDEQLDNAERKFNGTEKLHEQASNDMQEAEKTDDIMDIFSRVAQENIEMRKSQEMTNSNSK